MGDTNIQYENNDSARLQLWSYGRRRRQTRTKTMTRTKTVQTILLFSLLPSSTQRNHQFLNTDNSIVVGQCGPVIRTRTQGWRKTGDSDSIWTCSVWCGKRDVNSVVLCGCLNEHSVVMQRTDGRTTSTLARRGMWTFRLAPKWLVSCCRKKPSRDIEIEYGKLVCTPDSIRIKS